MCRVLIRPYTRAEEAVESQTGGTLCSYHSTRPGIVLADSLSMDAHSIVYCFNVQENLTMTIEH